MDRPDELIESFSRSNLILFLKRVCPDKENMKVIKGNSFQHVSRKKTHDLNTSTDSLFRPELQAMFKKARKVGYLRKKKTAKSSIICTYLMLLTNIGILIMDPLDKVVIQ